jgi:hypothetical protein
LDLIADGLKHEHNTNTFNGLLGHQAIEVVNGGEIETKILYLVKGDPATANLQYDGTWGLDPNFEKINHYENQSEL